jgi:hypothetical protein
VSHHAALSVSSVAAHIPITALTSGFMLSLLCPVPVSIACLAGKLLLQFFYLRPGFLYLRAGLFRLRS